MLSLMDPVELEDLVVFRDDEDPRKFYLLPDQPVIPLDDRGEPEFLFIKYLRDVESTAETEPTGGGLLQFRAVLNIAPERRDRVIQALRARLEEEKAAGKLPFGRPIVLTEPLLAEPLWTEGQVGLATFKVSETGLVRHATESALVDLAGDLGASLSVELDPDGAEIFWGAFERWKEGQIPILVTFQLKYKARVSAKMTIHAVREVIHRQIWQAALPYRLLQFPFLRYVPVTFSGPLTAVSLARLRSEFVEPIACMVSRPVVREVLRQTIVNNQIKVRIETDTAGGGSGSEQIQEALFKIATEVLSDRVIPALFGGATGQPGAKSADDRQANQDLFEVREQDSGGGSASFDLELDNLSTIERTVNPNGPIRLLLHEDQQSIERCFRVLRLADGFFSLMKVSATTVGVNFEHDGIDSIHVFFRYEEQDEVNPERPWVRRGRDGMLRSEKDVFYWRFDTARDHRGRHKRGYQYRMDVFYREGPPSRTEWTVSTDRDLAITPRAMGALRVELVLTAPKERIESARVALRYQSTQGLNFETALELTPEASQRTWFQYTGELADDSLTPRQYSYQVTYRTAGSEIVMPWVPSTAQTIEIPSPFKKILSFIVRPQGSFDGVSSISGDIAYEDPAHGYRVRKSFQLPNLTAAFSFEVPILEGGPEQTAWVARINRNDGSAIDLAPGTATPSTVWVGGETDFLTVQVIPDLLDFEQDVQLALVELSYADPANGISARKTFTFSKAARGAQTWTVGRRDRNLSRYDADIRYIAYDRAKSSEVQLRQIDDQILLLDRTAV